MERLYHISEESGIKVFHPRPSPSFYDAIKGDVVFAISDKMLHNYLLPRNCPRVTYYTSPATSKEDKDKFFGSSKAGFIINVEEEWIEKIKNTVIYKYEFSPDNFILLDEIAGYYVSYEKEIAIDTVPVTNISGELISRNAELRCFPSLMNLAEEVKNSTLNFSMIRMKNCK